MLNSFGRSQSVADGLTTYVHYHLKIFIAFLKFILYMHVYSHSKCWMWMDEFMLKINSHAAMFGVNKIFTRTDKQKKRETFVSIFMARVTSFMFMMYTHSMLLNIN